MNDNDTEERGRDLLLLTAGPAIWALHFLLSYVTAAVWCGVVAGRDGSLSPVRLAIAAFTVVALLGIGITGRIGYQRHSTGSATVPHDFDTREDRHRFLGFATLLLAGMSAVATIYVALAAVFLKRCY